MNTGTIHDAELAELDRLREEYPAALDTIADLRDRLDHALTAGEQHQAARGRAVNAVQIALSALERARDRFQRAGMLDEAACVQRDIARTQELAR